MVHSKKRRSFEHTNKNLLDRDVSKKARALCKEDLKLYLCGWTNYFYMGLSRTSSRQRYDKWIRRRIRQLYWKIWKKPSTRVRALMKLGIERSKANEWGNSSKAYWRVAGSWILGRSLTNDVLQNLGSNNEVGGISSGHSSSSHTE